VDRELEIAHHARTRRCHPDPVEGPKYIQAGQLNAVVPILGSSHFEDALHVREIDLA
jgi:hypothetical protein